MLLVIVLVVLTVTLLLGLVKADCDLYLLWHCTFGNKPDSLRGKVVWVTGASSGIGEALVYRLATVGCKLILSARREERLAEVKNKCLTDNPTLQPVDILTIRLDLLDFTSHRSCVDTALKYLKKIDILVNNAGRSQRALWERTPLEVDEAMLKINTLGPLSLTKCVLPHMIKQKAGRIVVTSSIAGKLGAPGLGSYSGSKHALHGWFECLRLEEHDHNIGVTMVCPGPVFSEILQHAFTDETNKTLGVEMKATENRMTSDRCAYLMTVAMANYLDEVWLSKQPELSFLYLYQYFPTITRRLGSKIGSNRVAKIRAGMPHLH